VIIEKDLFMKIRSDRKWLPFLVFDTNGRTLIDLEKYSANKCYLPIGNDYVNGYLFTQKLYDDKYRTENNLVLLAYEEVVEITQYREWRIPVFNPSTVAKRFERPASPNSEPIKYHTEQRPYLVKKKVIKYG